MTLSALKGRGAPTSMATCSSSAFVVCVLKRNACLRNISAASTCLKMMPESEHAGQSISHSKGQTACMGTTNHSEGSVTWRTSTLRGFTRKRFVWDGPKAPKCATSKAMNPNCVVERQIYSRLPRLQPTKLRCCNRRDHQEAMWFATPCWCQRLNRITKPAIHESSGGPNDRANDETLANSLWLR